MKFGGCGVIVIDKAEGFTSRQIVSRVQRIIGAKKAGHTGTLDPFATGVLPVCLNRATILSGFLSQDDKVYEATFSFGKETSTGDVDGEVIAESKTIIERSSLEDLLHEFMGNIEMEVPSYSAVKVKGRPLYYYARKGIFFDRPFKKTVSIYRTEILNFSFPEAVLQIHCSKGTYIRSLATQFGRRLGSAAHLKKLRRLRSGKFELGVAISVEELENLFEKGLGELEKIIFSPSEALSHFPAILLMPNQVQRMRNGAAVSLQEDQEIRSSSSPIRLEKGFENYWRFLDQESGALVAVGERVGPLAKPVRVFL